jgi:hypothetical protein
MLKPPNRRATVWCRWTGRFACRACVRARSFRCATGLGQHVHSGLLARQRRRSGWSNHLQERCQAACLPALRRWVGAQRRMRGHHAGRRQARIPLPLRQRQRCRQWLWRLRSHHCVGAAKATAGKLRMRNRRWRIELRTRNNSRRDVRGPVVACGRCRAMKSRICALRLAPVRPPITTATM